jgi:hypothetical protein
MISEGASEGGRKQYFDPSPWKIRQKIPKAKSFSGNPYANFPYTPCKQEDKLLKYTGLFVAFIGYGCK